MFKIKRTTDPPDSGDGFRVLIDRVLPRAVNKAEVSMDLWLKEIAPSTELDQWFARNPEKWEEFQRRYARELDTWPQLTTLLKVRECRRSGDPAVLRQRPGAQPSSRAQGLFADGLSGDDEPDHANEPEYYMP